MADLRLMSEQELRNFEVKFPRSLQELENIIEDLTEREHDYGTCVYAMSIVAVAAFNYVAAKLGCTGFQAGCADLDIICRTRDLKHGFMIIDYSKLLYPQYCNEEHFPSMNDFLEANLDRLGAEAEKLLKENHETPVHPDIEQHWKNLVKMRKNKLKERDAKDD